MPAVYQSFTNTPSDDGPAIAYVAITPNDSADLATTPTKGIYIGGAGNISVIGASGTAAVTFVGVLAGTILNIRATRVNATGTTATSLVALY